MGYNNPDPYYQPEKFGLEPIGEIDDPNACYNFDILAVWRHKETGDIYWATDSGCSCPSPFENYDSLESLEKITDKYTGWDEFYKAVMEHCNHSWGGELRPNEANSRFYADKVDLLRKVLNELS